MNRLRTQMRWIMIIIVAAFLLSTFLMYGSSSQRGASGGGEDYAVAEVNGRNMMLSTMYDGLRTLMENAGNREITSADYQAVLENYAVELQMDQEIRDSGITVTDADVDQAMKEYIDLVFPTRESFYSNLERSGTKLEDYKSDMARQMVRQKFIEESIGTVVVSEDEAVQFYDGMKNIFFRQPAGYMVNLARFSSENEAQKVRALLYVGRPWSEVTSHDVVASPDILYVTEEPTFFSDLTFDGYLAPMKSADIGAVSPVFEVASNDFAVGVKSERVEETVTQYEEVSADIKAILQQQKTSEAMNNFSVGLLSRADIVILDQNLFPSAVPDFQPVQPVQPVPASGDQSGEPAQAAADAAPLTSQDTAVTSQDS